MKSMINIKSCNGYRDKKKDIERTGQIDLLQVRNNLVYILDYKPETSKDKRAPWQL